jgi:hypothetical protein
VHLLVQEGRQRGVRLAGQRAWAQRQGMAESAADLLVDGDDVGQQNKRTDMR